MKKLSSSNRKKFLEDIEHIKAELKFKGISLCRPPENFVENTCIKFEHFKSNREMSFSIWFLRENSLINGVEDTVELIVENFKIETLF